ncbi:hypothetical protein V6N12_041754 [Hibiscus sabdariffa]|uniref:Uncharacterized protein n=1 Tax=Hibiscus sabdariffa TaxID=183260 RepID=A0ABR2B3L5_9ROSI
MAFFIPISARPSEALTYQQESSNKSNQGKKTTPLPSEAGFVLTSRVYEALASFRDVPNSEKQGLFLRFVVSSETAKLGKAEALIPLHNHQQLSYCITQFVEKDFKLANI